MIANIGSNGNLETVKIILGFISGIVISAIGFLFTHRFNWRNYLTQEFRVFIKINVREVTRGDVKKIVLNYEINCTNSEEMSINYIYFIIPENIKGNIPPNATLGETLFENKGRFYVTNSKIDTFKHNYSATYTLEDEGILNEINNKNIKYISFVVNTSKYGDVESNEVRVSR
jgi:hypothetical protein